MRWNKGQFKNSNRRINGKPTKEYSCWKSLKKRCYCITNKAYPSYGGRGITVCDRWLEDFDNFFEDMGLAPSKSHSLDRIDNNGNYCKENCRWATPREQNLNKPEINIRFEYNGELLTVPEIAEKIGIKTATLYCRLNIYNIPLEKAFTKDKIINRYLYKGEYLSIKELSEKLKIPITKLQRQTFKGLSIEQIVEKYKEK